MLNKNVLADIVDSLKCNYISEDLTVMESAVAEALKKYWSLTEKGDIEDVMDALADNGIEVKELAINNLCIITLSNEDKLYNSSSRKTRYVQCLHLLILPP